MTPKTTSERIESLLQTESPLGSYWWSQKHIQEALDIKQTTCGKAIRTLITTYKGTFSRKIMEKADINPDTGNAVKLYGRCIMVDQELSDEERDRGIVINGLTMVLFWAEHHQIKMEGYAEIRIEVAKLMTLTGKY